MHHDSASFWADIKNFEERLARDPDSYLFARLSEVYLKVHLIDDALHTARQGVVKYPTYISGLRALAMASFAKGLHDESRKALEMVAAALPEDVKVQKLLGKLLVSHGSFDAAQKAFRTALEFSPNDEESLEELKALLERATEPLAAAAQSLLSSRSETSYADVPTGIPEADDDIIELQESDIVEEFETIVSASQEHHDPLSTATLADLYVQQGFIAKALEIYRAVLTEDPANSSVQSRISELEAKEAAASVDLSAPSSSELLYSAPNQELESHPSGLSGKRESDSVIFTLEGWLDNIRRIKACR